MSEAIVVAHWPGKDTAVCARHLKTIAGVARALGFEITADPAEPGVMCTNCENEDKRKQEVIERLATE